MVEIITNNTGRFLSLVLLQCLILNNVNFTGLDINPFLYVLFILLLPFETPDWLLLTLSFALGITVDIFSDSFGIHAASTLVVGFLRPTILEISSPREGYDKGTAPRVHYYGMNWFFRYTLILIFAHHLSYYFFDAFSFNNFFITIGRIALSSIFTTSLIILSQYIIFRR
jgi:hypothetical protein